MVDFIMRVYCKGKLPSGLEAKMLMNEIDALSKGNYIVVNWTIWEEETEELK